MKYFAVFLVFTIFSILYLQDPAFACQCVADRTLQDEYDDSDFIFSATVLDITSGGYKQVSVEAMDQWKGDVPDKISFMSCRGVSSGGIEIKTGQSYLFFAENTAQKYPVANDCGHTKLLSDAKNEILFLDQKSNITRFHYDDSEHGKEVLKLCDGDEDNAECNLENNDTELDHVVDSRHTENPNECWILEDDGNMIPCKMDDRPSMILFFVLFWPYIIFGIAIITIFTVWRKRK